MSRRQQSRSATLSRGPPHIGRRIDFSTTTGAVTGQTTRATLRIAGMYCAACAMAIDLALEDLPGVAEARTSYARGATAVTFDPARVGTDAIIAAIREAGYDAHPFP